MNVGDGLGASASPWGDRYTVIRELGQGGSTRTLLAQDHQRQDELCVIKEFVPQVPPIDGPVEGSSVDGSSVEGSSIEGSVDSEEMLTKAKALFEQEAKVLCQLDHEQIPKFRQLPPSESADSLYLAQDYVQGSTYQALLEDRKRFGGKFSETEITQLLYQLLPVLSYIHGKGVIHRDISPDNLILRLTDGLPVLVDFGSVTGKADPSSDLYALATTLLTLVSGKDPQGPNEATGLTGLMGESVRGYESLSPKLAQILKRMRSPQPDARFPTAEAVLEALQADDPPSENPPSDELGNAMYGGAPSNFSAGQDPGAGNAFNLYALTGIGTAGAAGMAGAVDSQGINNPEVDYEDGQVLSITTPEVMPTEAMGYVDSAANESEVYEPEMVSGPNKASQIEAKQALIGLLATLGLVSALLMLYALARGNRAPADVALPRVDTANESRTEGRIEGEYSVEETARRQTIRSRREAQGISESYFTNLIDQLFYQEYPMLLTSGPNGGRKTITSAAADEPLRIRWDNIATRVLNTLEGSFSGSSLSSLGTYNEASRDRWRTLIEPANVSDRALNDLVDAKFLNLFPNQSGQDFLAEPVGQLYYALAEDRAQAISAGGVTETVRFAEGTFSQDVRGQLNPGEGRIYLMSLSVGQLLRLSLEAPAESTQLSIYPPEPTDDNPALIADSRETNWSGSLTQTGLYEVVVINRSGELIDYSLTVSVDNITSTPVAPPAKPAETPDQNTSNQSTSNQSTSNQSTNQNSQSPNGSANPSNSAGSQTGTPPKMGDTQLPQPATTNQPATGAASQ